MTEVWSPVEGYENLYEVSNLGRVRSYHNNKYGIAKTPKIIKGQSGLYNTIVLARNGEKKTVYLHRLVAVAFVDNPHGYNEINHIDGNKKNNCYSNLEWVTHKENMEHASKNVLLGQCKAVVCLEDNTVFSSITDAGRSIGIRQPRMSELVHGKGKIKGKTYVLKEEMISDTL